MKPTFGPPLPKHHILFSHFKMMSVTRTLSAYIFTFKTEVSAEKKCFSSSLKIWLSVNDFLPHYFLFSEGTVKQKIEF